MRACLASRGAAVCGALAVAARNRACHHHHFPVAAAARRRAGHRYPPTPTWPCHRSASTSPKSGGRDEDAAAATPLIWDKATTYKAAALLTGSQFVNNVGFGCVIPVLPIFAAEMGLGPSGVGLILSSSAFSRLLLNVPFSRLADSVGRLPPMVAGQWMTAAASIGTGLCAGLPMLLACRLLIGVGTSASLSGSAAYMADITARLPGDRAKILGLQSTVINMAYAAGPAIGGVCCDLYGVRTCFYIVGGAAILTSVGYSLLPETLNNGRSGRKAGGRGIAGIVSMLRHGGHDAANTPSAWSVYKPLLRDANQQSVCAMHFAVFTSYSALMTVFPLHAVAILGDEGTASMVGAIFAASAVVGFGGAPFGGYLADRFGRKATIVPSACLISAGALLTANVDALPVEPLHGLLAAVMLWGLGNSMTNPGLSAFAADIAKDETTRAQTLSLTRMASDGAFLLAPVSLGVLASVTSCSTAMYATALIILGSNALFAVRAKEEKRE